MKKLFFLIFFLSFVSAFAQTPLPPRQGGLGISNSNLNTLTFSGAYGLTLTLTGVTSLTLPTSGTLLTSASAVTSVGLSLPNIFTISNSPVTTTGTLTAVLASQNQNLFLASPNGSSGTPSFRAIVSADIPTLNQNTTGTASNVTGTVAIANGGTGQTTANTALNALLPSQGGNANKVLQTDGSNTSWVTAGAGAVTSVGLSLPDIFTVTNSPVTTSGTLTGTLASQTQNKVFASPDNASGTPSFRALVSNDIPSLTAFYEVPLTFSTGLTRTTNTVTVNTSQNIATLSNLNTNGFVKTSGLNGTLSIDGNTYTISNNAITGATKTKITYDTKGLVTSGADATTADVAASTNKNYVTDAQLTVIGNTSGANTGDITIAGENYLSLSGQAFTANAVDLSGTNATGILAAARFPALTGDVTTSSGAVATTIANSAVTLAKMANMATSSLIYRKTAGSGAPEANTLATLKTDLLLTGANSGDVTLAGENYLSISSQVITANAVNLSGTNVTGTLAAARFPSLTGEVTTSAGSLSTSIARGTSFTWTALHNFLSAGIATTYTNQIILENTTASTSSVKVQQSPSSEWLSHVWSTTATAADTVRAFTETNVPVTSANPILANLVWQAGNGTTDMNTVMTLSNTGILTATTFSGALSGNATTATNVAASGLTGTTLASGVTASSLTSFGSSIALGTPASGTLTNCTFPTLNQSTTGSAATLTTARGIYGNNFDGSAALTQIISSVYGGTGNGFTKFSGAASSEKTYTLPNASATILTDNAAVTVAQGGTGAATLTGILKGNGTSAVTAIAIPSDATKFLDGTGAFSVPSGGSSGISGATNNGAMYATAATTGTSTGAMTDGQLLIGYTSHVPILGTLTGTASQITVTNGNGTITLSIPTSPAFTTPAITGLATGSGVASAATASTLVARDANANVTANNWIGGYRTTATAGATTTLTVSDTYLQYFTGSTTQTVALPAVSSLALGHQFVLVNNSTGAVTVNSSGGNAVIILAGSTSAIVTSIATSGTDQTVWSVSYAADNVTTAKKLSVSNTLTLAGTDATTMTFPSTSATIARTDAANTFTGVQTMTSPNFTTPVLGTPTSGALTNCTSIPVAQATGVLPVANGGSGWTNVAVVTSDFTTSSASLVDITGLSFTAAASTNYFIDAFLDVVSSSAAGDKFGLNSTGTSPTVDGQYIGETSTGSISVQASATNNSATGTALGTSSQEFFLHITGFVKSGTGSPTISIRGLKVTSGTLTVRVGSFMNYRVFP